MKKLQRIIKFKQKWYIGMILKNTFLKLINNAVFAKTMESVRKHTDTNLATIETRRNIFVSEPNIILQSFLLKRFGLFTWKSYLRLSIIELNKVLMYEFLYGYVKPKYG